MTRGLFGKLIVVFCVLEMAFMQVWAMRIASRTGVMTTELLAANHLVFGGELLFLCLKRIFAKDRSDGGDIENED